MNFDDISQYEESRKIILDEFKSKRSNEPMVVLSEVIEHVPLRIILSLKITTEESLKKIRKFIILKEVRKCGILLK